LTTKDSQGHGGGIGHLDDGEMPPPTALAGRRRFSLELGDEAATSGLAADKRRKRGLGLSIWSLWGSKHDEEMVAKTAEVQKERQERQEQEQEQEQHRVDSATAT